MFAFRFRLDIWAFLLAIGIAPLTAQDNDILLNHDLYHYMDRLDIKNYTEETVHTDIKPYGRLAVSETFRVANISKMSLNEREWHQRMWLLADDSVADATRKKGIIKGWLYKNDRDFYHHSDPKHFRIYVNPAMQFSAGGEYISGGKTQMLSVNSRGIQVRGDFLGKIGFFTEVYDNVMLAPQFVMNRLDPAGIVSENDRLNLPGETYVKRFTRKSNGLDFFSTRAYATYSPFKQMRLKFGYDRAHWGNGYQSMLVSDHAANQLSLDITTRIWKLEYLNRFAQGIDYIPNKTDNEGAFPRKYSVFHQLNFKPNRNISVGVFEAIIYNPLNANGKRGLELQYFNPIIFYRSAEQALGSPDNGFIGFTAKYNCFEKFQFYGQMLLDDFKFTEFRKGFANLKRPPGYKDNKTGYQLGGKYIDVFAIPTLDLQVEFNNARPYLYQHFNVASNYTHFGQSLGYAYGGNARNIDVILRYHPFPQWNFEAMTTMGKMGLNKNNKNYGNDVNALYNEDLPKINTNNSYGYYVGVGETLNLFQLYGRLTYQIFRTDVYVELEGRYRQEGQMKSAAVWGGIRANITNRRIKY